MADKHPADRRGNLNLRQPRDAASEARSIESPPIKAGMGDPSPRWRVALFCGLVWLLHLAVQIDKPVHIDDMHYIEAAKFLHEQPLRPFCNVINWKRTPDLAYRDNINPPLYVYIQSAWMLFFGPSIRGLHVLASLTVLLATFAGYCVARRFTKWPMLATALFMLSPTLIPVTNLMLDVPALAVSLCAVAVFLKAVDEDRFRLGLLGGVLVGAAVMTKYNTAVLVPLLAFYAVLRGRPRFAGHLLIPPLFLLGWSVHNYFFFENREIHILLTTAYSGEAKRWAKNILSTTMVLGSSFVFLGAVYLFLIRWRDLWRLWPIAVLAVIVVVGLQRFDWWKEAVFQNRSLEYLVFTANTLILLAFAAARWRTSSSPGVASARSARRDSAFLWAWALGVMAAQVVLAHHQSPRYHFLAFPPFAILLVRAFERVARPGATPAVLGWSSVAVQIGLGLFVASADHAHAAANRDFPLFLREKLIEPESRVFCVGHWGLQYYSQEVGFPCFDAENVDIQPGDLFFIPQMTSRENVDPLFYQPDQNGNLDFNRRLFDILLVVRYPKDRPLRHLEPTLTGGLLLRLYSAWPFQAVSIPDNTLLYASILPFVPYSWRPGDQDTANGEAFVEEFIVFSARQPYRRAPQSSRLPAD